MRGAREALYALVAACILIALCCQSGFPKSDDASPKTPVSLSDKEMITIFQKINMPGAKVLAIRPSPLEGWWEVGVENNGREVRDLRRFFEEVYYAGALHRLRESKRHYEGENRGVDKDRKIDVSGLSRRSAAPGEKRRTREGSGLYRPWLTVLCEASSGDEETR